MCICVCVFLEVVSVREHGTLDYWIGDEVSKAQGLSMRARQQGSQFLTGHLRTPSFR